MGYQENPREQAGCRDEDAMLGKWPHPDGPCGEHRDKKEDEGDGVAPKREETTVMRRDQDQVTRRVLLDQVDELYKKRPG